MSEVRGHHGQACELQSAARKREFRVGKARDGPGMGAGGDYNNHGQHFALKRCTC
jgi:hypothetical protein